MGWLQWRENGSPAFAREFCPSTLSSTGSMVVVGFLNQSIKSPTHNTAQDQVHRTRRCEKTYFTGANKTTKRRRASASPRARHGVWLAGCASATPPYSFSRADVIRFVALHTPRSPADFYLHDMLQPWVGLQRKGKCGIQHRMSRCVVYVSWFGLCLFSLTFTLYSRFMKHRGLFISCILLTTYSARKRNGSLVASYHWCIHKNSFSHTAVAIPITAISGYSRPARVARARLRRMLYTYDCHVT